MGKEKEPKRSIKNLDKLADVVQAKALKVCGDIVDSDRFNWDSHSPRDFFKAYVKGLLRAAAVTAAIVLSPEELTKQFEEIKQQRFPRA